MKASLRTLHCALWMTASLAILHSSASSAACPSLADARIPMGIRATAREIGAERTLRELVCAAGAGAAPASMVTALSLRQIVSLRIVAASLDVNYTVGRIDDEIDRLDDAEEAIATRRDRRSSLMNLANIVVGTGVGAVGSGLAIKSGTAQTGNIVAAAAGVFATGLSVAAREVKAQASGEIGLTPAMLAEIIGRTPNTVSKYPRSVWAFLNTNGPQNRPYVTWRSDLIQGWERLGWLRPSSGENIETLTTVGLQNLRLSGGAIERRAAMLADVRAKVSLFNSRLRDITDYIAETAVTPETGKSRSNSLRRP